MATETCLSLNSNSSHYTTPPIHLADEPNIFQGDSSYADQSGVVSQFLQIKLCHIRKCILAIGKKDKNGPALNKTNQKKQSLPRQQIRVIRLPKTINE